MMSVIALSRKGVGRAFLVMLSSPIFWKPFVRSMPNTSLGQSRTQIQSCKKLIRLGLGASLGISYCGQWMGTWSKKTPTWPTNSRKKLWPNWACWITFQSFLLKFWKTKDISGHWVGHRDSCWPDQGNFHLKIEWFDPSWDRKTLHWPQKVNAQRQSALFSHQFMHPLLHFCDLLQCIEAPYERFSENRIRKHLDFEGVPISLWHFLWFHLHCEQLQHFWCCMCFSNLAKDTGFGQVHDFGGNNKVLLSYEINHPATTNNVMCHKQAFHSRIKEMEALTCGSRAQKGCWEQLLWQNPQLIQAIKPVDKIAPDKLNLSYIWWSLWRKAFHYATEKPVRLGHFSINFRKSFTCFSVGVISFMDILVPHSAAGCFQPRAAQPCFKLAKSCMIHLWNDPWKTSLAPLGNGQMQVSIGSWWSPILPWT